MSTRTNTANSRTPGKVRLLNRYIGLETEYATVLDLPPDQQNAPSRREVFDAVCKSLSRTVPSAKGQFDDCQLFLANGGAVSLESNLNCMDDPGGLIEGATPECQSPKDLLVHQRAQDRLFSEAVADCELPATVRLLKNSRDVEEHVYGCQENYSADVASGFTLLVYRLGMVSLFPLYMLYVGLCLGFIFAGVCLFISLRVIGSVLRGRKPKLDHLFDFPAWCLPTAANLMRVLHTPLTGLLWLLAWGTAFRQQRKWLTPFLVSRVALCGTGHLDANGRFSLSGKALAINSVVGMGGYRGERPIYVFGHWLSVLSSESIMSPRCLFSLLKRRQRMQIGIADSNVADAAEYLKVGATSLVMDMIDAGRTKDLPHLKSPLLALDRITSDWQLIARVNTSSGPMSALEIQKAYFVACHRFVRSLGEDAPAEAWDILELWESMLDATQSIRDMPVDFEPALAKIDWASKKWLIDQMGSDASLASRKKVDIRYHELSLDGYYRRLTDVVPASLIAGYDEVEVAKRMPPTASPATRRGQLIREFADSEMPIRASWSQVVIGRGKSRKTVALNTME